MATSKKKAFYFTLGTGADAKLQLDPDIYDTALLTPLGLSATATSGAKHINVTIKQLGASSFGQLLRVTVAKGLGAPDEETRQVKLICEIAKVATAQTSLLGQKLKLGYGANAVDWEVTNVA